MVCRRRAREGRWGVVEADGRVAVSAGGQPAEAVEPAGAIGPLGPVASRAEPDDTGWSDSAARSVLQLMTESVAEMVGFEVAALSVVLDGQLVTMAYKGPAALREFLSQPDPVEVLDPVLRDAETWGRFRFLAEEDHRADLEGHWAVVTEREPDGPDSWRPRDVLMAFLTDDAGRLVATLSVDEPRSGRRPDATARDLLERYAAQIERAVLTAFERESLVSQVTHAENARRLIRSASMRAHSSLETVLRHTHRPLVEGFGAAGSWIQVFDPDGGDPGYARSRDGESVRLSERLVALAHRMAPRLWAEQRVLVVDEDVQVDGSGTGIGPLLIEGLQEMSTLTLATALGVPLGAGHECVGFLVLTRRPSDPPWTTVEVDSALQIGHDLGAALLTARALEHERALVRELQQLDDHRLGLIATLSHELRTPLAVISGNLEMLGDLDLDPVAAQYHRAMGRGTGRMERVVEDLLLLTQVSDPRHPLQRRPVDVVAVLGDVVELVESQAAAKGVVLAADVEPGPMVVSGDAEELDRLIGNLVSNAVKYTPSGGTVSVSARRRGHEVVLEVADTGLGISEDDQLGLFRPFFRTTNPDALREPGTGLGLAIVATITERHRGTVDVRSRLHHGTTFTVALPA
jgi:signal transduction histidine kinase